MIRDVNKPLLEEQLMVFFISFPQTTQIKYVLKSNMLKNEVI
jgi:hypothetical protein